MDIREPLIIEYSNGGGCIINPEKILYTRYYPGDTYKSVLKVNGELLGDGVFDVVLVGGEHVYVTNVDIDVYNKKYFKRTMSSFGYIADRQIVMKDSVESELAITAPEKSED